MASGDIISLGADLTLANEFGWAGGKFPFAGTTDITISADTIWNDAVGFKKVKKLTINAGIKLKIHKSPFYIFADEIVFGSTTSSIDGSGGNGYVGGGGAKTNSSNPVYHGYGGIMLFIICNKISGAAGNINANGGNGFINKASYAVGTSMTSGTTSLSSWGSGHGALSSGGISGYNNGSSAGQQWDGSHWSIDTDGMTEFGFLHPYALFMGVGDNCSGGGTGTGSGSGIGSGGGAINNGAVANKKPDPINLIELAKMGCLGGGGAGGGVISSGSIVYDDYEGQYWYQYRDFYSGGGGGGSVVVWARTLATTPVLQANGGSAYNVRVTISTAKLVTNVTEAVVTTRSCGGAGVTYLIQI